MKVCFLAHGASIHTRRWTEYFVRQGHRVSVVSLSPSEPIRDVELYQLASKRSINQERSNWHYLLHLPRLRKVIRRIKPDLVNAHFLSSNGFLGALVKAPGVPYVITLQGSDLMVIPERSAVHHRLAEFSISRTDLIVSVAQHMTKRVRFYNKRKIPVITLQYGIDTRKFSLPLEGSRMPIVFSNRHMVANSNLELLIHATRALKEKDSVLRVHLAGDGALRIRLENLVSELELEEYVSFSGKIDHEEMPDHLQNAAIFVSVVRSDGTPLSLLEAMGCGAFPVVSDIPANREWVEDGANGYLVTLDDPVQLAERLEEAWQNVELRTRAAVLNRRIVEERADYEKNMAIIEHTFISLVEGKSSVR